MTIKEDVEKQYSELLSLAKKYEDCFEAKGEGFGRTLTLKEEKEKEYWKIRSALEEKTAVFMMNIKQLVSKIPKEFRTYSKETQYDPSGEMATIKVYDNESFSFLNKSFNRLLQAVEGSYSGVLGKIERKQPIYGDLRNLRGTLLVFSSSIGLFIPELMMTIEKQVELIFKLRELGFKDTASEFETIESVESPVEKCTIVRNGLEKVVKEFLKRKTGEAKGQFYVPLDKAIEEGLAERGKRNAIAGHYTFISKMIHGEIEKNAENIRFAIDGAFNILHSLLSKEEISSVFTSS